MPRKEGKPSPRFRVGKVTVRRCNAWAFPVHFTLAKTGLRVGELVHLLIEDLDLEGGWLNVRNKTELGWRIKTGQERVVPLLPEVVAVLRSVLGKRTAGPVFLREWLARKRPALAGDRRALELALPLAALDILVVWVTIP